MKRLTISTCLAAILLVPAAAEAGTALRGPAFRVEIPVADLDLASEEGKKALFTRTRRIAAETCAPNAFPRHYDRDSLRACRQRFEEAASAAIARARG